MEHYRVMNDEPVSGRGILGILNRNYLSSFLAFFLCLTAFFMLYPTLPIFLAKSGSSDREIGVLIGILGASSLISRFLVGKILTKYSAKSVMMAGALLLMLTLLGSIVIPPYWPFLGLRFFQGIAYACLSTAAVACAINIIPLRYRAQGLGYFLLAPSFGLAVGPSFGMLLVNHFGFTILFLACTFLSACSLIFSYRIEEQKIEESGNRASTPNNSFVDLKIIAPAAVNAVQFFIWGAFVAFFPLYAIQCGVKNPGYFFTANAAMLIAGRVVGGKMLATPRKERIILIFLSTAAVVMLVQSFSKTLPLFVFVGAAWGLGAAYLTPTLFAYALDYTGSSKGPAVGTYQALQDLGMTLGPMTMGIILPYTGYRWMFVCLAMIGLLDLLYFWFFVRKRKKCSSHEDS